MKTFWVALLVVIFFLRLSLERPPRSQRVHDSLPNGKQYRELHRIGETRPVTRGSLIILETNHSPAGVVREYKPVFRFEDGQIAPAIRVQWNQGPATWVKQKELRSVYTGNF